MMFKTRDDNEKDKTDSASQGLLYESLARPRSFILSWNGLILVSCGFLALFMLEGYRILWQEELTTIFNVFDPPRGLEWIHSNDSGTYLADEENKYVIKKIDDPSYAKVIFDPNHSFEGGVEREALILDISPNLKYALLKTLSTLAWTHSDESLFWILDIETKVIKPLDEGSRLVFAKWSPDSSKLAYLKDNNIFVANVTGNQDAVQVTFDGDSNILNGRTEPFYEEEVFQSACALWWSPDSQSIGFLKFDVNKVRYLPTAYSTRDGLNFPRLDKIRYQKAGYINPTIEAWAFQLHLSQSKKIFANIEDYKEYLVTDALWVDDHKFFIKTTHRLFDDSKAVIADAY